MNKVDPENGNTIPTLLKQSIDNICEALSSKFDKELFRGKKGDSWRSVLYNVPVYRYYDSDIPLSMGRTKGSVLSRKILYCVPRNAITGNMSLKMQ